MKVSARDIFKYILQVLALAAVYFLAAKFGLSLAIGVKQVTLVWPPTGIAIAALLIFGRKLWPGILIGAFFANITTLETLQIASWITIGNTLEALLAYYLLDKFNFDKEFHHVNDIVKFMIWGAFVPTIISATIGTTTLAFGGTIGWSQYLSTWTTWWLGDATGAMIFGPLILSLQDISLLPFSISKFSEFVFLTIATSIVSILVFTGYISNTLSMYPTKYLVFPFMIWSALSFGIPGATFVTILISVISILGFIAGGGPFVGLPGGPQLGLILLQILMVIFSVTAIILAAAIEERKRTEGKIIASEKRFKALIENSTDVIVLMDETGKISYTSPSTYKILKFTSDELLGTSAFDRIHPDDRPKLIKLFQKLVTEPGKIINTTFRLTRKDEKVIWVDGTGSNLLKDPNVSSIIINYRDVTEHQKIDEAKTEFVSLSAHQLRSPLSTIRWYTEALIKEKSFPQKLRPYLQEVYGAVLNMNETINLLLDISKFELGTVQVSISQFNLDTIIDEVIASKSKQISSKSLIVTKSYKNKISEILGDAKLSKIIIENLVSNAIKYTPIGGKITINLIPEKDNILFKITDTGIGIPVEDQEKIFTKLYRGSNVKSDQQSGLGLGLYLVRLIIDLKGGNIWFESEEGKGTTFFVEFPKMIKGK